MILGHILGIPVEETAAQFVPAGAATLAMIAIAGRTKLGRLRRRFRRRMRGKISRDTPEIDVHSFQLASGGERSPSGETAADLSQV
jgi:hypothetical protein